MCRLVSLSLPSSPFPPLANAITVELYRNASIYCEMAVIDFRLCCARVCVCVYRCYSIFLRVYWRNNFQPRLDLLFQFSLELALLFMYLTFYCVMCSNCHQNVHKLRKYVCE